MPFLNNRLMTLQRDLRLDTLRGLFLVLITINHFGSWSPEGWWVTQFTWQPLGYVSAAEGFVFLSGFIFATVYVRYSDEPAVLWRKAWQRAFSIYLYHIALVLGLAVCFLLVPVYRLVWEFWFFPYHLSPLTSTVASLLLLHQPPYLDILPIYAVLVFFSPPILLLLARGQHWLVLTSSFILWVLGQQFDPFAAVTLAVFPGHWPGYFNLLSWQFLYVFGLFLGNKCYRNESIHFLTWQPVVVLIFFTAFLLFLSRHALGLPEITMYLDRPRLEWLRLANFLLLTACVGVIFPYLPVHFHCSWLTFLGRHSLQVFSFHVGLLYLLVPVSDEIAATVSAAWFTPFILVVVLGLTVPAFLHSKYKEWALASVAAKSRYATTT